MLPLSSTAMPSGAFSPVLEPLMVAIGATLPSLSSAYSVMLLEVKFAT